MNFFFRIYHFTKMTSSIRENAFKILENLWVTGDSSKIRLAYLVYCKKVKKYLFL